MKIKVKIPTPTNRLEKRINGLTGTVIDKTNGDIYVKLNDGSKVMLRKGEYEIIET